VYRPPQRRGGRRLDPYVGQPLGAIRLNVAAADMLIASNRATSEELRAILRDVRDDDTRIEKVVERHRTMLKKKDLETQSIDIGDVVRESVALLSHEIETRHAVVTTQFSSAAGKVAGDPVLLQQVVVNLITNALDAMADTPVDVKQIVVRTVHAGDHVEVSVRDHGAGLAPSMADRLFEPFVSTKQHGLGIGLSIVRGIVEAHGGTIQARNAGDGGAEFRFTVPIAQT